MKVTTTFWSDDVHEFDKLLFIRGKTKEILFEADLNDAMETYTFFKNISNFVKLPAVRKTAFDDDVWYQFAVMFKDEVTCIKWFDLVVDETLTLSHDIAFSTTLIRKNDVLVPFGKFPMWYKGSKRFPKYRELNIKSRAYKYLANRVKDVI